MLFDSKLGYPTTPAIGTKSPALAYNQRLDRRAGDTAVPRFLRAHESGGGTTESRTLRAPDLEFDDLAGNRGFQAGEIAVALFEFAG
jgi:hypothetical protein